MSRYATIADLPAAIPVFPLLGAILLPRSSLPLNIFEPRYLAMVNHAIRGDRVIGMIQPAGEGGDTGSPAERDAALARVGCAGRITSFQELDDGRLLIVLSGLARFVPVTETAHANPFRTFEVDYGAYAGDLVRGSGESEVDRSRLLSALKKFLAARNAAADWQSIAGTTTEQLVNFLSLASPFGPKEKQALLEAQTLKVRAETLIALAEMEIAAGGDGSGSGSTPRLQ